MTDPIIRLNAALEGRYRIQRELGEGGMATVYLAEDLRHERKVALKVLKPELAAVVGAERFLAEIKTTANLTHPHILPLHDSGEADGFLYFVTPYIEGDTLRDKIDREKQLGVDEAVAIASDISEALDYAHRSGVVHRDIKPANILLTDGGPVIADFGIALAVAHAGGGRVTETGLSVGTPHYMSPEQATGERDVTPRSDVYALGCVLYEMLAGEPPYQGGTAQAVLAKILTDPTPAPIRVRVSIPRNVDAAIRRALEKLPADRFASAQEFVGALGDPGFRHGEDERVGAAAGAERWKAMSIITTGLAVAMALALAWTSLGPGGSARTGAGLVRRTMIPMGEGRVMELPYGAFPFDLSDDGSRIAFVSAQSGRPSLYIRDMSSAETRAIDGSEGARHPFFSPNGDWVGFFADGELRKASVERGTVIPLGGVDVIPIGATWGRDSTIVYSLPGRGLFRIHENGGPVDTLEVRLELETGQPPVEPTGNFSWPDHLPDGQHLLVGNAGSILLVDLETLLARRLVDGAGQPSHLPGYLVVRVAGERLAAIPFDDARAEVRGPSIPIPEEPYSAPGGGATLFRVDQMGNLLYVQGGTNRSLVLADRNGRERSLSTGSRGYRQPRFSPDGSQILVGVQPGPDEIWIVDVERGTEERILSSPPHTLMAVWHPDGDRFAVRRGGQNVVYRRADLSDSTVLGQLGNAFPVSWSRDGRALFLNRTEGALSETDLWWVDVEADTLPRPLTVSPYRDENPMIAPSADYVAYVSDRTGSDEVYVASWPEWEGHWRVSLAGGREPLWSRDGTELFFVSGNRIMSADVTDGFPSPDPVELFRGDWDLSQALNWDVSPEGEFVFVRVAEGGLGTFGHVANWIEEIQDLSDTGG